MSTEIEPAWQVLTWHSTARKAGTREGRTLSMLIYLPSAVSHELRGPQAAETLRDAAAFFEAVGHQPCPATKCAGDIHSIPARRKYHTHK